jgi:hypothetical protein
MEEQEATYAWLNTQGCPSPSGELAQTIRQKDCNWK